MPTIRVAVLDMAGTTVQENGLVEEALRAALAGAGSRVPSDFAERFNRFRGGSKLAMFEDLMGGDRASAERAHALFERELADAIGRGRVTPVPGAESAMLALKSAGVKVALTTGFAGGVRDRLLSHLGWSSLIDLALSPEDAGRGRPHPDLVLTAFLRLEGEDVREVAVAGDTVNDMLAGSRAGASIVAGVLTGAHTRAQLEQAPHTHILEGIAEFPDLVWSAG